MAARTMPAMQNHYEVLGVAHNATPAVVKIAYEGKLRQLARSDLADDERKEAERELERAYVTLSNPAKKQWYDRKLEEQPAARPASGKGWIAGVAALVILLTAGGAWYSLERTKQRERVRLEEQRLAIEAEKARAQAEIEKARLLETQNAREQSQGYRREVEQSRTAERERRYQDAQQRAADDRAFQSQARERALKTHDERERQRQEDRDRRQAEEDRRKAWAEVERQKRFVAEREREEERARADRHYRERRDAAEAARAREAEKRSP